MAVAIESAALYPSNCSGKLLTRQYVYRYATDSRIQKKALEHSKEEQGLIVPQCTGEVMDFVLPQMGRKILHVVGIVWKSVSEAIGTAIGRDVELRVTCTVPQRRLRRPRGPPTNVTLRVVKDHATASVGNVLNVRLIFGKSLRGPVEVKVRDPKPFNALEGL